jgi:hypothetical protein
VLTLTTIQGEKMRHTNLFALFLFMLGTTSLSCTPQGGGMALLRASLHAVQNQNKPAQHHEDQVSQDVIDKSESITLPLQPNAFFIFKSNGTWHYARYLGPSSGGSLTDMVQVSVLNGGNWIQHVLRQTEFVEKARRI